MSAIDKAVRAGVDLSLIDESLRLTPEQRTMERKKLVDNRANSHGV